MGLTTYRALAVALLNYDDLSERMLCRRPGVYTLNDVIFGQLIGKIDK